MGLLGITTGQSIILFVAVLMLFSADIRGEKAVEGYFLTVDSSDVRGSLPHFWRSTGFCPPLPHEDAYNFDLGRDMRHNLIYIGSIPFGGVRQVRIHWLLDLVKVERMSGNQPVYDFTYLDAMLDQLHQNGLQPGFEIMGNPSNIFTDFENTTQVHWWKDLVHQFAHRYIGFFGLGVVMDWNFETWNEPDCKDFDNLKMTVQGFLNYYDACSEGLLAASTLLKFGGPGDGCKDKYAEALYSHAVNGTNFFTGAKGVRIDFISLHKKGDGSSKNILMQEVFTWESIRRRYPSLAHKPFYNDEADPLVGWSRDKEWRADARYAAMVAKVIVQHQNIILADSLSPIKNYSLLSNDNGFLSYYPHQFSQRTLMARFQINNTAPPHVQFLRKPVHSVMGLLAYMGERQVHIKLHDVLGLPVLNTSRVGAMAGLHKADEFVDSDSWQLTVLMYNSDDTSNNTGMASVDVKLTINPPNASDLMLAVYSINQSAGNPYSVWKGFGKPNFPTVDQFRKIRLSEGPVLSLLKPVKPGLVQLPKLTTPMPGVHLLHVCAKPKGIPDQVSSVSVYNITGGQVLISWSDKCVHSRCLLTYQVEYSAKNSQGPYVRINNQSIVFTVFVFAPGSELGGNDEMVCGFYRVRGVDYWGRLGMYSLPVKYPEDQY